MVVLHPGEVFLVEWKKVYRGDAAQLTRGGLAR
jgi:hypothetical protein